jgi:hypothetical protein
MVLEERPPGGKGVGDPPRLELGGGGGEIDELLTPS